MTEILVCPICNGDQFEPYLRCEDFTVSHETFNIVTCSNCQFTLTNPVPDATKIGNYYLSTSYISHSNKAATFIDKLYLLARSFTLRWKVNLVQEQSTKSSTISLLDYGCGTGAFLKKCKSKGWNISGIEPSDTARQKSIFMTGEDIAPSIQDLNKNNFDIITLWHVLEHIYDLNNTLQKLKDKLHSNGTLFIAVPNLKSLDAHHYSKYWAAYDVPRHLWHFSQQNMERLLQQNGLKLIHTLPMKLDSYYVSILSEKYKNNGRSTIITLIKGILTANKSNRKAKKTREYSSLIYIVRK